MNHELVSVIAEYLTKGFSSIINRLIIQEMQLLQHINQINLFLWSQILFDNLTIFLIKLLNFDCFGFFLFDWWQVDVTGREEAVAVGGAGDAAGVAEE